MRTEITREQPMGDKDERDQRDQQPASGTEDESDTEGHGILTDPGLAAQLSRNRSAEIEREARARQRRNEAKPPRNQRG